MSIMNAQQQIERFLQMCLVNLAKQSSDEEIKRECAALVEVWREDFPFVPQTSMPIQPQDVPPWTH